jgi:hypothetical protein
MNTSVFKKTDSYKEKEYHQAILDVAYALWQDKKFKAVNSYAEMVDYMEKKYGSFTKFIILAGKFNNQVCNGGHTQYYENGYADRKDTGFGDDHDPEIPLHKEMVELMQKFNFNNISVGRPVFEIMDALKIEIDDTEQYTTCTCSECNGNGAIEQYTDEEDEDGDTITEEVDCEECGGSGEIEEYNEDYGCISNSHLLTELDTKYYQYNEKWMDYLNGICKQFIETGKVPIIESEIETKNFSVENPNLAEAVVSKEVRKPKVKLIGTDSNVFSTLGIATGALRRAGMKEEAEELTEKVMASQSYDHALATILKYVDAY